jgi:hypothetical protein
MERFTDVQSVRSIQGLLRACVVLIACRKIQLCVKFSSDVVVAGSLAAPALGLAPIGAAHSQEDDQPDEQ